MPRMNETLLKKPIKRLQNRPRLANRLKVKKEGGDRIIQKLLEKLMGDDANLDMNNKRYTQHEKSGLPPSPSLQAGGCA